MELQGHIGDVLGSLKRKNRPRAYRRRKSRLSASRATKEGGEIPDSNAVTQTV